MLLRGFSFLALLNLVFGLSSNYLSVGDLGNVVGVVNRTEWTDRRVFAFRGIPYAEPPVGDLRFRPPVRVESWGNEVLDATAYGPACPQEDSSYTSENCLTLGVFVPETEHLDNGTLLPVLIYIHGGTFREGSAITKDPVRLLFESDLIVVVPQFRLGLLGLYSLQTDDVPGNVQFLDQIMAMQWVQDNIEYFGGDKNRVTLWGQSSGAASVHFHLLSPLTEGLFHQTILQSGSALRTYGIDPRPEESGVILANYCGCRNATNVDEITYCMKALPVDEILNCSIGYLKETIDDGLTRAKSHMAVIQKAGEQKFLVSDPAEALVAGNFLKLPMLGGVAKNDGSHYTMQLYDDILVPHGLDKDENYLRDNFTSYVIKWMGIPDITGTVKQLMKKTYFPNELQTYDLASVIPGIRDMCSLIAYKSGGYETVHANRKFKDTYVYTFDYLVDDPFSFKLPYPFEVGVTHGDDFKLMFPAQDYHRELNVDMAKLLIRLWTSFAINGVPSAHGVTWPVMSTPVGPYLVIDSQPSVRDNFIDEFVTIDTSVGSSSLSDFKIRYGWLLIVTIFLLRINY
ncbi:pyrethroid hydrolase Ces2a-like [Athalia rosae]|uniref:pyrethroid hydrolase Ces2a-like n=1 Tax=Athalia rosae TaxID=37344 RepID=UPI0020342E06|nr:pyrethroid hydrolase Ces2a-like [Athalia rosae]